MGFQNLFLFWFSNVLDFLIFELLFYLINLFFQALFKLKGYHFRRLDLFSSLWFKGFLNIFINNISHMVFLNPFIIRNQALLSRHRSWLPIITLFMSHFSTWRDFTIDNFLIYFFEGIICHSNYRSIFSLRLFCRVLNTWFSRTLFRQFSSSGPVFKLINRKLKLCGWGSLVLLLFLFLPFVARTSSGLGFEFHLFSRFRFWRRSSRLGEILRNCSWNDSVSIHYDFSMERRSVFSFFSNWLNCVGEVPSYLCRFWFQCVHKSVLISRTWGSKNRWSSFQTLWFFGFELL